MLIGKWLLKLNRPAHTLARTTTANKQTDREIQDTTCILWSVQISAAEKVPKQQEQEHGHLAEYK